MLFITQLVFTLYLLLPANAILRTHRKVHASCGDSTESQQYCKAVVHPRGQWKGSQIVCSEIISG